MRIASTLNLSIFVSQKEKKKRYEGENRFKNCLNKDGFD
jgi:hypothetical protein